MEHDPLLLNYQKIKGGDDGPRQPDKISYEDALKTIGYGKFHVLLLALCGWAVSSDAIEVLSVSFMLPSAQCDLHLTSADKGLLNAIIFVGMMVGGYFWGSLADKIGRRTVLMGSLTVNGLGGLVSSTSQVWHGWSFPTRRLGISLLISSTIAGHHKEALAVDSLMTVHKINHGNKPFQVPGLILTTEKEEVVAEDVNTSYYGLWMWFPEIFARVEKYGGSPCDHTVVNTTGTNETEVCNPIPNDWVYKYGAVRSHSFPTAGRKDQDREPAYIMSTAFGLQSGVGRIAAITGNMVFGALVDIHCAIPMIMVAVLLTIGGLSAIKLPNTTGKDIH
ncbi:SV2B-like protein [Mya arenaria]|uniref:SV2B-like protein n=1 Tax=Mya arenaria TaxID=6604 RepID=A0ABY7EDX9_MYAAR|nr:SV2B-like protein [Mya arenaria]